MKKLDELGISPTPWSIDVVHDKIVGGDYAYLKNGKGEDIHVDYDGEFSVPDATLMAAAPVLFKAAYDMCYRQNYTNCKYCDYFPNCGHCPYREIRLALEIASGGVAEAKGEAEEVKDWEAQ